MNIKRKILVVLSSVLFPLSTFAQLPDPEILASQYNFLQNFYSIVMRQSDEILNGREYEIYFYPQFSSPLIPSNPLPTASIIIKGRKYEKIGLQYDTYKDKLVYYSPGNWINNTICPIAVNQHIVEEFYLQIASDTLRFIYMEIPEEQKGKLKSGYHEIVYDTGCQFIIKHASRKVNNGVWDIYVYERERYILNGGICYRIKGKRSLLKALADKTAAVKRYMKSSAIQVKTAEKNQIESILEYYNSLKLSS